MTFPHPLSISRLRFVVLASTSCAALAFACGGISDPTRGGSPESVATVSGALTGVTVPANAHVALVWRKPGESTPPATPTGPFGGPPVINVPVGGAYEVGADAAIVNGTFAMNLAAPSASLLAPFNDSGFGSGSGESIPPSSGSSGGTSDPMPLPPSSVPSPGSGGGKVPAFDTKLAPRDIVSGGITQPLTGAIAGFVVYTDANGNGKLDLQGPYADSPDTILGGNTELILTYLSGGGALEYEKLRDKSGVLPAAGFNLVWTEGRWLPLNEVELKLDKNQKLPYPVCSSYGTSDVSGSDAPNTSVSSPSAPTPAPTSGSSGVGSPGSSKTGYPDPSDPNLKCASDGRSFSYTYPPTSCPPPPPTPVGLCASDEVGWRCAEPPSGYGQGLADGAPVPPGWPCPTTTAADAGTSPNSDAGSAPPPAKP